MATQKPANWNQMSPEDQAQWLYLNAGEDFVAGGPAQYQWQGDLNYDQLGSAPKLGQTNLSGVTTDPKLLDAQMKALAALELQGESGLSAGDELALNQTSKRQASDARARQMTMEQNLARKGRAGGRLGVTMQMQAAQNSDQMAAEDAARRNAMAQDGRLQAKMGAGQMAGNMSAEEYRRKANQASAQDNIDQFNNQNSIRRQEYNNGIGNQGKRLNWEGHQNISNQNTDAEYGYRKDKMGVQQDGANNIANRAAEEYNRKELKKQRNAGRGGRMLSGAAQGAGAGAAFGPWGAAAGGVIGAAANYAKGGKVPGDPLFPGIDTELDDTFEAQLSPGEIVIPKSLSHDPVASAQFVAQQNAHERNRGPFYPTPTGAPIPRSNPASARVPTPAKPTPIPEPVLKQLESSRPDLVAAYRKKMADADQGVKDAESFQSSIGLVNFLGKAANDYSNNQKNDVVLKNRMQDWGKAPQVKEASVSEYDSSLLDKLGASGVAKAKESRDQVGVKYAIENKFNADDPNSQESMQAREYFKRVVPGVENKLGGFDQLSATQVKELAPGLYTAYNAQADRDAKAADRAAAREQSVALRNYTNQGKVNAAEAKQTEKMEQLRIGDLGFAQTPEDAKHLKDAVETKASFDSKLDELIKLREDKGVEYLDREAVGRGKQLSKELLLDYKNLAKLGVLSQSDEAIINAIIPSDPLGQDFAMGQDPILSGLKKWKGDLNRDYQTKLNNRLRREGRSESAPSTAPSNISKPSWAK